MSATYRAQARRDRISWWAEVIDADTGRTLKSESCFWEWSAKRCSRRLLKKALRHRDRLIVVAESAS